MIKVGGIGDSGAQHHGCSRTQQAADHHTARGIHQAEHGFRFLEDSNVRALQLEPVNPAAALSIGFRSTKCQFLPSVFHRRRSNPLSTNGIDSIEAPVGVFQLRVPDLAWKPPNTWCSPPIHGTYDTPLIQIELLMLAGGGERCRTSWFPGTYEPSRKPAKVIHTDRNPLRKQLWVEVVPEARSSIGGRWQEIDLIACHSMTSQSCVHVPTRSVNLVSVESDRIVVQISVS
jgi:hypothetical protein